MINLRIDQKKIIAEEGKTILEVAKDNNIRIPVLCENKKEDSLCSLCLVNVVGMDGLVDASKVKVKDGMKIFTNSRAVRTARKLLLELILSDHYADCKAPCNLSCPLNMDIQNIIAFIKNDSLYKAIETMLEENPFPLTLSKICNAECEDFCRRKVLDRAIKIKKLIEFVSEYQFNNKIRITKKTIEKREEKIAIIGAGVSGLSCAYFLSKKGYNIDIYDALSNAGGLLRYAIPDFKLPKDILDFEINNIFSMGINFIPNTKIGKDLSLNEISNKYDAVYVSTGLQKNKVIEIKNFKKTKTIMFGIEFLKKYHTNNNYSLGKNVIVYGNGELAINCARIIKRMGSDVTIYYQGEANDFNADEKEIKNAGYEGVNFAWKHTAVEIKKEKNKFKKMVFKKFENGYYKRFERKFDYLILAFDSVRDFTIFEKKRIRVKPDKSLRISENSLYSGIDNIFVGGDFRFGISKTAALAILDGKKAAKSIEHYLTLKKDNYKFYSKMEKYPRKIDKEVYKFFDKVKKDEKEKNNQSKKKIKNFSPIEIQFNKEEAIKEASLCLECGCKIEPECKLKKYAEEYRININNYKGTKHKYPIDNRHPFIIFDANKCIKCGACVEECSKIIGANVLGYTGKGFDFSIIPSFEESLSGLGCLSCGRCIEVCPTSALFEKNINYFINTKPKEEYVLNCGLCGLGCEIIAKVQDNKVMLVKPSQTGFNQGYLCFEGKFGWQIFEQENRIKLPLIRVDKTNDWQEEQPIWKSENNLLKIAKEIKKQLKKAEKKAIYIDPIITIEEVLLMKVIAERIGAEISSFSTEKTIMDKFYNTIYAEKRYSDLKSADVIVLVGDIPLVLKSIVRKLQLKGKKIIVIDQEESVFNKFADVLLDSNPINNTLEKIIEYNNLDCDCNDFSCDCENDDILAIDLPPKTMFVYNKNKVSEEIIANIIRLSYQICREYKEGSGIFEISDFGNSKGFIKMNIKKCYLQISDFVLLYGAMPNSEQLKWLEKSKFVISVDTHLDKDNIADIFIPEPDYFSIDGISLGDGGKILKFKNIKKANYFDNILTIFKNAGLLNKEESDGLYWNKKAKELIENLPQPISYDENKLAEIVESIEEVNEKVPHYYPVYYFEIGKLKKMTKSY